MPSCVQCGQKFEQTGRGRPRVRCLSCSPARTRDYVPRPRLPKVCGECGESFDGSAAAKFCSPRCRDRASEERKKRANPCPRCGNPMSRKSSTSAAEQLCRSCRNPLPEHGELARYQKHKCRCDKCRAANARETRRYSAQRKAEGRPLHLARPTEVRTCEHCDSTFSARLDNLSIGRGRFCSSECAKRAQGWDGTPRRRFRPSKALREFIVERDGGFCQLCFSPVRFDVDSSHPRFPHLDHIIPMSLGGSDEAENLRLACAQCNTSRGANVEWTPVIVRAS